MTDTVPKPLLDVGGRPFLGHLLDNLSRFGFEDIVLICGYLGEQIVAAFDRAVIGAATVRCVVEPEPAGTGGALCHAEPVLDEEFLLCNGDSLFDINLLALIGWRVATPWIGKLGLRRVDDAGRYGSVVVDGDRIARFVPRGGGGPGLINGGVYHLRRTVLDFIERRPCSIEAEIFPRLAARSLLYGQEMDGFFVDIGIPDALAAAQTLVPARPIPQGSGRSRPSSQDGNR